MSETNNIQNDSQLVPAFGLNLLRDDLIPEFFGDEANHILYWAGKHLARKYKLAVKDDLITFFKQASWGDLEFIKEKKEKLLLKLSGPMVEHRFTVENNPSFKLEAGFVAEQLQSQTQWVTESYVELNRPKKQASIIVKWDKKEIISPL